MIFNAVFSVCLLLQVLVIIGLTSKIDSVTNKTYFDGLNDGINITFRLMATLGNMGDKDDKDESKSDLY